MLFKKESTDPAQFWQEYEKQVGEKVLAFTLGQYISGWDGEDHSLWGLIIATSGGFRFHHFPHEGWIQALTRVTTGGTAPKERTLFIPKEKIVHVELVLEKSLLKRIFFSVPPRFVLRYIDDTGVERLFIADADTKAAGAVKALLGLKSSPDTGKEPSGETNDFGTYSI
ncbi:MAG: hypothetical protein LBF78_09085 [Treponema sp.]|jgi:hypothetical protein|nr:hypothetical protein [Treponema sp.]